MKELSIPLLVSLFLRAILKSLGLNNLSFLFLSFSAYFSTVCSAIMKIECVEISLNLPSSYIDFSLLMIEHIVE